jgi:hypothetical protein
MSTFKLSLLVFVACSFSSLYASDEEGRLLYINTCEHSGMTPGVISSAQAEFICVRTLSGNAKRETHLSARGLFKGIYPAFVENRKSNLCLWETVIHKETPNREPPVSFLCAGNTEYWIGKDIKAQKDRIGMIGQNVEELLCISRTDNSPFAINSTPAWCPQFQIFGRIRGYDVQRTIWLLLSATNSKKIPSTEKGLSIQLEYDKENKRSYVIKGNTAYDDQYQATILEILTDGKLTERYWIDSSRGYVCPLVQRFSSETMVEEHTASKFVLHKPSGLWYPSLYTSKTYQHNPPDPNPVTVEDYSLVPDSLSLNKPLPDGMFALDVPAGGRVNDTRIDDGIARIAKEPGALSFKDGDIDITSLPWLNEHETAYTGDRTVKKAEYSWAQVIFVSTGTVLILAALVLMYFKRKRQ